MDQPTTRRLKASMTTGQRIEEARMGRQMMSATHSRSLTGALKSRLTRSRRLLAFFGSPGGAHGSAA